MGAWTSLLNCSLFISRWTRKSGLKYISSFSLPIFLFFFPLLLLIPPLMGCFFLSLVPLRPFKNTSNHYRLLIPSYLKNSCKSLSIANTPRASLQTQVTTCSFQGIHEHTKPNPLSSNFLLSRTENSRTSPSTANTHRASLQTKATAVSPLNP